MSDRWTSGMNGPCAEPACETPVFDAAGFMRRARRIADLSQRDLAAALGTSTGRIARMESGTQGVGLYSLTAILWRAGLRLAVMDGSGREVEPVSADGVRDNAGRRFPAHLDVQPPDVLPYEAISSPRYDRQPAKGWYHLREERDVRRADGHGPAEHPTATELEQRRRRRLLAGRTVGIGRAASDRECDCATECWMTTACVPECECRCEPVAGR